MPDTEHDSTSADEAGSAASQPPKVGPLRARFDAANTTHDGNLTKEQAAAGKFPGVAKNFDTIDVDRKGYVTFEEVKSFRAVNQPK